jgi:hypothetical protein
MPGSATCHHSHEFQIKQCTLVYLYVQISALYNVFKLTFSNEESNNIGTYIISNEFIKLIYSSSGIKPASYSKKLENIEYDVVELKGPGAVPSVYNVCNEITLWVINTLSILWSEIMSFRKYSDMGFQAS